MRNAEYYLEKHWDPELAFGKTQKENVLTAMQQYAQTSVLKKCEDLSKVIYGGGLTRVYSVGYMKFEDRVGMFIPVFVTLHKEVAEAWAQKFDRVLERLHERFVEPNRVWYRKEAWDLKLEEHVRLKHYQDLVDVMGSAVYETEMR